MWWCKKFNILPPVLRVHLSRALARTYVMATGMHAQGYQLILKGVYNY